MHEEYLLRKDDEIASERVSLICRLIVLTRDYTYIHTQIKAWAMSEEAVLRQMEATEAEVSVTPTF